MCKELVLLQTGTFSGRWNYVKKCLCTGAPPFFGFKAGQQKKRTRDTFEAKVMVLLLKIYLFVGE